MRAFTLSIGRPIGMDEYLSAPISKKIVPMDVSVVPVALKDMRHRGSHGGMTADEMRIPVLLWRA